MNFRKKSVVAPGSRVRLKKFATDDTLGVTEAEAAARRETLAKRLEALQEVLYAEQKRSVLIVLQAMDAGGKDGTIQHVMSGVNPQGCTVTSFKPPSTLELAHDFLWRVHAAAPARGKIGIFNRSHYEDVLVTRVHNLVPKKVWGKRFAQINAFEELLTENGTTVLKFFLHISKDEQKRRFDDRLKDPEKYWKASLADFKEREFWDQYQEAYEDVLERCSTDNAPWFIIPADHKWFRDDAISEILVNALERMKLEYPKPTADVLARVAAAKK